MRKPAVEEATRQYAAVQPACSFCLHSVFAQSYWSLPRLTSSVRVLGYYAGSTCS